MHKQVYEIKILSFYHFLKTINFKGFAKWSVLNQIVRTNHSQGHDLIFLNKQKDCKDVLYLGLLKQFKKDFIIVNDFQIQQHEIKQRMFMVFTVKILQLTYMLKNLNAANIKEIVMIYMQFMREITNIQKKYSSAV